MLIFFFQAAYGLSQEYLSCWPGKLWHIEVITYIFGAHMITLRIAFYNQIGWFKNLLMICR